MGFENFSFLARKLPSFKVHGSQIRIIHEPSVFYQELVSRSAGSQERIVMSALYWGVEVRERKLRDAIASNLSEKPNLRVKILLDWCRGTRIVNGESSATILQPLHGQAQNKNQAQGRCQLSFYQTPQLRGWLRTLLPSKWNELLGLQHCKVYIFDNSLIISGANLSKDYFTNRQDRYILVENCKELSDYYEDLIDNISEFSFKLNKNGEFTTSSNFRNLSFSGFIKTGSSLIQKFITSQKQKNSHKLEFDRSDNKGDTFIFPTVQMGLYNINQDCDITSEILQSGAKNSTFHFATGYFNLIERFMQDIIKTATKSSYNILMAHPEANGFLGAKFPAGGIPHAYTLIAKQFYERVLNEQLEERVNMFEFRKLGWTFHGKGMWYSELGSPCLTLVGSPNFGYRSERRDLESQLVILTKNEDLQMRLKEEQEHLFRNSEKVCDKTFEEEKRTVPFWVQVVVSLARKWF